MTTDEIEITDELHRNSGRWLAPCDGMVRLHNEKGWFELKTGEPVVYLGHGLVNRNPSPGEPDGHEAFQIGRRTLQIGVRANEKWRVWFVPS
jgi:hypothetical protein